MATGPHSPTPLEPHRLSLRLPRPLSIGLVAAVLVAVGVGLSIDVPAYRQRVAIQGIRDLGGSVVTLSRGPKWLRHFIGSERNEILDVVIRVTLDNSDATDPTLRDLKSLPGIRELQLSNTQVTDAGLA